MKSTCPWDQFGIGLSIQTCHLYLSNTYYIHIHFVWMAAEKCVGMHNIMASNSTGNREEEMINIKYAEEPASHGKYCIINIITLLLKLIKDWVMLLCCM